MIQLENIEKIYGKHTAKTHALRGINLHISEGEFVSIIGKSGCGKSTLLHILGGMDRPSSGQYLFQGKEVSGYTDGELAHFRNHIGFVFQAFHLINELTVLENIAVPIGYRGESAKRRRDKSLEMLDMLELSHLAKKYPNELSGGERQRIAIARALVTDPQLVLADEPTGNLDEKNGAVILDILMNIHQRGCTVIMVTHDLEMAQSAPRIVRMEDGLIVEDKTRMTKSYET